MKLSWKASISWKDNIHLANEYICDGRLTRHREYGHREYGCGTSHIEIISSRLYSIKCPIAIIIIIAVSLTTVPTSWATPPRTIGRIDNQISEDSVISFDYLSDDWAPATDPSYGDRLFYLVCNADYSAVPDDMNEAEKRRIQFSFLDQDDFVDVEEEERVRGRERIEQTEIRESFVIDLLLHLLCNPGVEAHIPPALGARDRVQQGNN
eukprot:scaffold4575_cov91-Skeletonema_dohrnii-CCMP3373.AAC.1